MSPFRLAVGAVFATAAVAAAQPQPTGGPSPPAFGSYLNLINRGGSPALNYFGIVRPQQQLAQQFNQLNQQQRQLGQNIAQVNQDLQSAEAGIYGQSVFGYSKFVRRTGFMPSFNNTGHYFSSNPALGGAGGGAGRSATGIGMGGGAGGGTVGPRSPFAGAGNISAPGGGAGAGRGAGGMGGGGRR